MNGKKIGKAILLLCGTALVFWIGIQLVNWVNQSATLSVNDVIIEGNRLINTAEIMKLIPVQKDQNIADVNLEQIKEALEKHPYVQTALVSRRFPSALRIEIVERVPVALLAGARKLYTVDASGTLLPRLQDMALKGLPVITGIDGFKETEGEQVRSERIREAIDLFNLIRSVDSDMYQKLSEIHYDSGKGFWVYFNKTRFPVLFGYSDYYEKAQKLQAFFRRVKEEKRYHLLKFVDLRFREQVVAKFN